MNKLFLIGSIIIILLITPTIATTPDYDIVLRLNDKNIQRGEHIPFTLDIRGSGQCEEADFVIFSEGAISEINKENLEVLHSNSRSLSNLHLINGSFNITHRNSNPYCTGDKRSKNLGVNLAGSFIEAFNHLRFKGSLEPLENSQGGEYDIKVNFYCDKNGISYKFSDENSFRITYFLEEHQYLVQILIPILSFFAGALITFLHERFNTYQKLRREIYWPLSNEFRDIIHCLDHFSSYTFTKNWEKLNDNFAYYIDKKIKSKIDHFIDLMNSYSKKHQEVREEVSIALQEAFQKRKPDPFYDPSGIELFSKFHSYLLKGKMIKEKREDLNSLELINSHVKNKFNDLKEFFIWASEELEKLSKVKELRSIQRELLSKVREIKRDLDKKL